MDCSPPGSSVLISQTRIQEWVAIPFPSLGTELESLASLALTG